MAEHRKDDVATHRQPADDRAFDVQLVEQVDGVPGVVVDGCRGRVAGAVTKPAEFGHNQAPSAARKHELRVPHAGIQREAVNEDKRAGRPRLAGRRDVEISQPADSQHGHVSTAGRRRACRPPGRRARVP